MIKISLYENPKDNEEYIPHKEWTQVLTNPSSLGSLLITIDNLKDGQALIITKDNRYK